MPQVKGKAKQRAARPAGKSGAKPGAKSASKPARRPAAGAGPAQRLRQAIERYSAASAAGFFVIAALVVALLAAGGYASFLGAAVSSRTAAMAQSSGLRIAQVTLLGAHNIAHQDILDAIDPAVGASILHYDIDAARVAIERMGWVEAASVSRLLPDTLHISIRERRPAALWQENSRVFLIDATGAVIREASLREYTQLPLVVGSGASAAAESLLRELQAYPGLQPMISSVVRIGDRRWSLRLRNEVEVKLPETAYADAIATVWRLQEAEGVLDRDIEYIDLRDPNRIFIQEREPTGEDA